jgi:hypothetical protein
MPNKKLHESGPAMGGMGGSDPSLTMGNGMGSGDSMESMMGGGASRPMNPAPKSPRKKRKKR